MFFARESYLVVTLSIPLRFMASLPCAEIPPRVICYLPLMVDLWCMRGKSVDLCVCVCVIVPLIRASVHLFWCSTLFGAAYYSVYNETYPPDQERVKTRALFFCFLYGPTSSRCLPTSFIARTAGEKNRASNRYSSSYIDL